MHLYLHVPFCARRCTYCDFAIAVRREVPSARYVERVLAEWTRRWADPEWRGAGPLRTLYLGGGTPSRLDPGALADLLARLTADLAPAPGAEITLEANPEDVTTDAARAWYAAGVNRVSLGAQSFEPGVLEWMHRTHSTEDIGRAVARLRDAGVANLSLDLIFGLPPALGRDWSRDLDRALALEPDHLSLYGLTVEPHTPLARWVDRGETRTAPDDGFAAEFLEADRRLGEAGFQHYEVSNYARPGRASCHNLAYWQRAPYLGLGPSAHSAAGDRRWWNLRDWNAWERAVAGGATPVAGEERLDARAVGLERLYLGLRTRDGVPADTVEDRSVAHWVEAGWAEAEGEVVRLTPEGWLRLDALVAAVRDGSRASLLSR